MRNAIYALMLISLLTACSGTSTAIPLLPTATADAPLQDTPAGPPVSTASPEVIAVSTPSAADNDLFSQMGISLPAPGCTLPIQPQMEGPYYKAGSPERYSLLEEGMSGTRLILAGYVLDQNCNLLPNAWIDFWQADASGGYDNTGYRLRGHQYTDTQGRYYLETVLPGLYASRPIEHIHVKVRPEGGEEVTSQLYFPNQPMEGLTVTLEDRGDLQVGYFNFVIPR
jgi:protocatechuate 3,4-dioxygenase beta subunit